MRASKRVCIGVGLVCLLLLGVWAGTTHWRNTPRYNNEAIRVLGTMNANAGYLHKVAVSPGGRYVACGSGILTAPFKYSVRVWDIQSQQEIVKIDCGSEITALAFSPSGTRLGIAEFDSTVRLWDTWLWREERRLGVRAFLSSLTFAPDGDMLAMGECHPGGMVTLVNLATGACSILPEQHELGVHDLAFSKDGKALLAAGTRGPITLWELAPPTRSFTIPIPDTGPDGPVGVHSVAFAPDGQSFATAGAGGVVTIWGRHSRSIQEQLPPRQRRQVNSVDYSGDASVIALGCSGSTVDHGEVRFWDCSTQKQIAIIQTATGEGVGFVRFLPGTSHLIVGYIGPTSKVELWDVEGINLAR